MKITAFIHRFHWFESLSAIILIVSAVLYSVYLYKLADQNLRSDLLGQTNRIALAIDLKLVTSLSGSESDVDKPEYLRLKNYLVDTRRAYPESRFFYVMRQNASGLPVFLVDSELAGSPDESLPGNIYHEATDELLLGLSEGVPAVVGPVSDVWGEWVSALVPVIDENDGEVGFLFGMDIDASKWSRMVLREAITPICLTWLLAAVIFIIVFMTGRRSKLTREFQGAFFFRKLEFMMVVLLGFSLTAIISWHVQENEKIARKETFERVAAARSEYFSRYFYDLEYYSLDGLANLFQSSQYVDHDEFLQYTLHLSTDPKTKAWLWVPMVEGKDLAAFEEDIRNRGMTDFMVWEWGENGQRVPAKERQIMYPVLYISPPAGDEGVFGFDMASLLPLSQSFEEAAATRLTSTSGSHPLALIQEPETNKNTVLVIRPIINDSDAGAQSGFVVAVLWVDPLLEGALGHRLSESPELTMRLYQMSSSDGPVFLTGNSMNTEMDFNALVSGEDESYLTVVQPLYGFGTTFSIIVQSNEVFDRLYPQRAGYVSVLVGLVITLLAAHALNAVLGRSRILERRVSERTAELRSSEMKYRHLAESTSAVLYEYDLDNDLMAYIAPQVTKLTGWGVEQWTDNHFWLEHLHPEDKDRLLDPTTSSYNVTGAHDYEYRFLRADGSYTWVRDVANEIHDGQVTKLHGFMVDINVHKQREKELQTIAIISAALRSASSRAEMLPIIVNQLMTLFNTTGVALALVDDQNGELYLEAAEGEFVKDGEKDFSPGKVVSDALVIKGNRYLVNELSQDEKSHFPFSIHEKQSAAGIPLMVKKQVFGAIWVSREYEISSDEMRLLVSISDFIGNALNREALREEMVQQLERLAALRAIDQVITSTVDLRVMMGFILEQVATRLRVDATAFYMFNQVTRKLKYYDGYGFLTREIDSGEISIGEGCLGMAALKYQTITIPALSEVEFTRSQLVRSEDFVSYFATPVVVKGEIKGVLEVYNRSRLDPGTEWMNYFETLAGQTAIAIENSQLFEGLQRSNIELSMAYDATIEGWSLAMDLRDHETEGHTRRVTELTVRLVEMAGLSDEEIVHIRRGALLHDIGKLGVPDSILHKPGPLDEQEWEIMRQHPRLAYHMLSPIQYLRPAIDIPYCHHEKWDGTGYPRGLKGEAIPFAARIFAIIDVYDALTSDRPYREAWPLEKVMSYIESNRGTHFDPGVVDLFNQMISAGIT